MLAVICPWYFICWVYTFVLQADLKRHERDYTLIQRENIDLSRQVMMEVLFVGFILCA